MDKDELLKLIKELERELDYNLSIGNQTEARRVLYDLTYLEEQYEEST